jgi:glycosyltransferase involved in cell wall biosynthesis
VTSQRVLYVINGFDPGGAEHGLLTLLQHEFFGGHDLRVLAFCRGRGALATRITEAVGAENVVIASPGADLTARALLAGARALWREHRQWHPDVVVLSLKQANIVGRLVACAFPRSRCVSFEHISRYRARRFEWMYRYVLWALSFRVDEIWADSNETHRETLRYFVPRRRRQHVVPIFHADAGAPYKQDYRLHAPLRLAAAGRLVGRKNLLVAIEAVRRLRERGDAVHLEIIGDGPDAGMLQQAIDTWGLGDAVTLAGYRQDWAAEAMHHDIFLNLGDTEGFCIVVAEAMAAGLPIVATDVGGIKEYGHDGVNMLKIDTPDATQVVAQVERFMRHDGLRQRLGETARLDMLAKYSGDAMRERSRMVLGPRAATARATTA